MIQHWQFFLDQPTYYHFHIHVVHVNLDPTATQAVGKALALDNVISQLETMAGDDDAGMADVELSYTVGEASELWSRIFQPLKEGKEPDVSSWAIEVAITAEHYDEYGYSTLRVRLNMILSQPQL
jgi:hypothetical protein